MLAFAGTKHRQKGLLNGAVGAVVGRKRKGHPRGALERKIENCEGSGTMESDKGDERHRDRDRDSDRDRDRDRDRVRNIDKLTSGPRQPLMLFDGREGGKKES